TSPKDIKQN
ncbi:hypothetical protein CP8484711_1588, partial [Chlamydia psittaci 84-8471/1]